MSEESTPRETTDEPRGAGPSLHEFISAHRAEILTACVQRMQAVSPERSQDELARKEGTSAVIEIEDECGGLPPGDAAELLAPFVQRTPDRRGLGLGLTITHEAVQAQGGELSFRNLPGRGCVFTVTLPTAAH